MIEPTPRTTRGEMPVTIRPIRPEDEQMMVAFHRTLSDQSVHQRYFGMLKLEQRTAHERLLKVCFNDWKTGLALVVEHHDSSAGRSEIVAVGRLSRINGTNDAELALLVSDSMQNRGLGTQLAACLVSAARAEKLSNLRAEVLRDNVAMRRILKTSGFTMHDSFTDSCIPATLSLLS